MNYNGKNLNLAKNMRSHMTHEEVIIWNMVRAKKFLGFKFKRQVLIGDYIVDFVCESKKLILEIDGGQHNEPKNVEYDKKRTEFLNSQGYKVLRFWNNEIRENISGVYEVIMRNLLE